jgi:dipeptidyl-peptidase 4
MIAYVRDDELHTMGFSNGETRQLTYGARENRKVTAYNIIIEQCY